MEAFHAHANMANPEIKGLLMDWAKHWEKGGLNGHVFCDDVATVEAATSKFGANFEFFKTPPSSGAAVLENGEFSLGEFDVKYFPLHGRCEPIVLMAEVMGLPYKRSVKADWPKGADKLEFRGLPQTNWGGKWHGQTKAVIRAIGMGCGLYDTCDPMCAYACDVTLESFDGIMGAAGGVLFAPDADKKKAAMTNFEGVMKNLFEFTEGRMKKNDWCYIAGNKMSVADFIVGHVYFILYDPEWAFKLDKKPFESYPCMLSAMKRLEAPLANYLKDRQFMK